MNNKEKIKTEFKELKLDRRLHENINRAGYENPTPVQAKAIPHALRGKDLIVTAQTGTGKTAAFVLPTLQRLLEGKAGKTRALFITPTRELAAQIKQDINDLNTNTGLKTLCIYGGVNQNPQVRALKNGTDIIVACPGRLIDLLNQGHLNLRDIEILVLDEADRMLDMGFLPDIKRIIALLSDQRQSMLFSATFPKEIEDLARKTLRNPLRIEVGLSVPVNTVSHFLFPVPQHLKTRLITRILNIHETDSVLIFTRTKHRARKLAQKLEGKGYRSTSLHSNKSQRQRDEAIRGFKNGRYNLMVATDIAARGLDIDSISHVINFDMPASPDDYIHRIGRTGRAERTGKAFTLITQTDEKIIKRIEKLIGSKIPRETVDEFDYSMKMPVFPAHQKNNYSGEKKKNFQRRNKRNFSRSK